eukprot:TRINITY_DN87871_c0_g1_i1.p1 TRINITY_DN87871_c0_g1~~TRINITY_DN87871_c0_g1_i1.p1  ORF type:complete len:625 (-),score=124.01 TRINITY_DN87871_c0_g1_i1:226-2100(-)
MKALQVPAALQEASASPKISYAGSGKFAQFLEAPETPSTAVPTAAPTPLPSPGQDHPDLSASWDETSDQGWKATRETHGHGFTDSTSWLCGQGLAALDFRLTMPGLQPTALLPSLLLTAPRTPPSCASGLLSPFGSTGGRLEGFEIQGIHGAGSRPRPLGCVSPSRAVAAEAALLRAVIHRNGPRAAHSLGSARGAAQILAAATPNRKLLQRATWALASGDQAIAPCTVWSALATGCTSQKERRGLLRKALQTVGSDSEAGLSLWDWWSAPALEKAPGVPLLLAGSGAGAVVAQIRASLQLLEGLGERHGFQGSLTAGGFPVSVHLSSARSVELALAAERVGKSVLKVASLKDLSPGCLANCIPFVVDENPIGTQCLSLTSSKEATMPLSASPSKTLMQQHGQGAMQKKRIVVMVDDLCLPMLPQIAQEPSDLFSQNALYRFQTAAGSSSDPKNCRFEALLAAQLQLRRPPAISCPRFPATAASCLESPDLCLLSSKAQLQEVQLLGAWERFVKAEKRSQQGTPLRLVASAKSRSAMVAVMMENSDCVRDNSGLEVLEQALAEPILDPCFTLPQCMARVANTFDSWMGPEFQVDQYCSDATAVIATAMSLATEVGLVREMSFED